MLFFQVNNIQKSVEKYLQNELYLFFLTQQKVGRKIASWLDV